MSIAKEAVGLTKKNWVLGCSHAYDKPIVIDKNTGIFEVDTIQLKVLAEELSNDPNDNYPTRYLNVAVKNIMGKDFDFKEHRQYTRMMLSDKNLIKKMDG